MQVVIKRKDFDCDGNAEVTFTENGVEASAYLPSALAETIKTRCEMKHGLTMDGNLIALFREATDRDYCRDMLEDVWPNGVWGETTC